MTQQAPDKINVFWFLPTHGDGRYLGTTEGGRPVDLPYRHHHLKILINQ